MDSKLKMQLFKILKSGAENLHWLNFIKGMKFIKSKTLENKIDLFIKMADGNSDGSLCREEVSQLASHCLKSFLSSGPGDSFLAIISEYFTQLVFEICNYDQDQNIPMAAFKKAILGSHKYQNLL